MKKLLYIITIMISLVSCDRNSSDADITLENQMLGITSAGNARQLGAYIIGDKQIKKDLLIRSARLSSLSSEDSTLLADKFKLQRIYDFRGSDEAVSAPDIIPGNAKYISLALALDGNDNSSVQFETEADRIRLLLENADNPLIQAFCEGMYDKIFFEESSQDVYRRFFADLVNVNPEDGAVLWHCTQGKDRAGSASAMLLCALGAERELIMADFSLSKDYYAPFVAEIPIENEAQSNVINTLISVNPVIFEKTLDKIDARYGSFSNYLSECLGVTQEMMETLREKFLE